MNKYAIIIITMLFLLIVTACPSPSGDTTPPDITSFTLVSDNPSTLVYINFTLNGSDDVGITGWMVNEDNTQPQADDTAWLDEKPEYYRLTGDGDVTIYAWAKDEAGNVSDGASLEVTYNPPADGIIEDDIYWNKMIDSGIYDGGYGIAIDNENNIYAVGFGTNLVDATSAFDWWIKKFDIYGNEDADNWDKRIDGGSTELNGNYEEAYSVAFDSQNNVYVAGYKGVTDTDSAWWIKKFDSDGNEDTTNWDKTFNSGDDGSTTEEDTAYNLVIDSEDNVYAAGAGYDIAGADTGIDWWIKKFDSDGNEDTTNWDKKIDGNGGRDHAYGIAIDSQDNIYVAGTGDDIVDGSSNWDWWIKKFDSDGNEDTTNWGNMMFSSDSSSRMDRLFSVYVDSQDNVWLAGSGRNLVSGSSSDDWWIKKFDSDGNEDTTNWDLKIDSGNEDYDYGREVIVDYDMGYVYVLGYGANLVGVDTAQDWWLKRFNLDGTDTGWEVYYAGNGPDDDLLSPNDDYAVSLIKDQNGDLYANGQGIHLASTSSSLDWWIKKFVVDE